MNPSEPMGPCETTEDCKYDAMMCMTEMPGGICLIMCNNDDRCNDEENGPNKCAEVNFSGYRMNLCLPGCEDDSQCRNFGYGYSMKCHKRYNEKENICAMPCEEDLDCVDEKAKCFKSRCVPLDYKEESDSDTDTDTDADTEAETDTDTADDTEPDSGDTEETVSDEEPVTDDSEEDMTLDDDQPKEKKKSGGCAITTL